MFLIRAAQVSVNIIWLQNVGPVGGKSLKIQKDII